MKLRATENNSLIPSIVDALNLFHDIMAFPVKGEGARGKRLVVPKGTADILGIRARCLHEGQDHEVGAHLRCLRQVGLGFAIETKWTHRVTCLCKSCQAQRLWRFQWEKRGGLYILARSPQEAIDGLMGRRAA